ncbi:MAG: alpha/beta hydrolase [Fibrobacter sp.]|uniref:poly(ethylene terephthalate) hydrolase family protein n=1 Tax=Fibrobacter sp. TaxID=35828 RepID=UPI0025BFE4AA|nr:alpha/beta hydrolase [Fibrobacter sp.]MBQ7078454.1 alpha/beta hydrolase [Fibrobacter sp.]
MKSKILKFAVLASAIAFINCGDETALAPYLNGGAQGTSSSSDAVESEISSSDVAQQGSNTDAPASSSDESCLASSLPDACGPGTNPLPTSSSDAAVASSADAQSATSSANVQEPASSSSEAAKPASSSSEKKVESSSSEKKVESSSSEAPKGIFLAEGKEEEKDQMQVEYKTRTGWDGGGILSYPKQLSSTQKHGVVVWGPGGGTEPGAYEGMIRRLASHGFVVIALKESPGDASQAIKALNWMDQQNKDQNSPLYNKLDMNTVGCSGHSMGGLESEQAVIKDKRVLTAFLNNSGDWNGAGANKVATDRTIAILFGEVGMEKDNAKNDYNNSGVKAPACLIEMTGGPRNSEGGYGHGSGSWDGMAATVAWMRWHLGGETERKADFVGTTGKYIDGSIIGKQGKWKTQCKNF